MEKKNIIMLVVAALVVVGGAYAYYTYKGDLNIGWSKKAPEILVVGKWKSVEDGNFIREFRADGTVSDYYEGNEAGSGTWAPVGTGSIPFSIPVDEESIDLKLTLNAEDYYFRMLEVTDERLALMYLDRGGVLEFERMK